MTSSEIAHLSEAVRMHLAVHGAAFGLDADRILIEPILNWGGFVNRSFRVSDGRSALFVKLSADPEIKRGLRSWRELATVLASRYRAPRMVGWLDLQPSAFCGPVFEWIEGRMVADMDAAFAAEISEMVRTLHADVELAAALPGPAGSCADAYLHSYHDRFTEDLAFVSADPPPFVSSDLLEWLRRQVALLETRVRRSAAFREPADRAVHGDLWLNNTLVDATGRWYLLDWDGLSLNDPVIDWTMLFGPSRADPRAATEEVVTSHADLCREERHRLAVYAQASQLDWILDPLADWVQSGQEPEHGDQVRAANERIHRQALAAYSARYG